MSIKALHILFITVSTLVCAGFAGWCFAQDESFYIVWGIGSAAGGVALVFYGIRFWKKIAAMDLN